MKESMPRQVDKKSGGPQRGGGVQSGILKEEKRTIFFLLHSLVLVT